MRWLIKKIKYNTDLSVLYIANFFFSLHFSFVLFVNSSFLAKHIGEELVGFFYIISSVVSIILFFSLSGFLRKFGNYRTIILLAEIELFALLGLGIISITPIVVFFFLIHLITVPLIFFNLDIFLEKSTKKKCDTGSIRGKFLMISSFAFILTPTVAGSVIEKSGFQDIYTISAFLLIPFIGLISFRFKKFIDPHYNIVKSISIPQSFKRLSKDKNVGYIFIVHTTFRIFTTWTLIYIPIYLSTHINFLWSDIGIMLTIMLLPYFLFEYPLGKIADKYLGEKEILISGFLLMVVASVSFSFLIIPSFVLWSLLLFIGRAGATAAEVSTESYFFKHVRYEDTEIISLFRMLRPVSYIISTIVAIISLSFIEFQFTFLILALLLIIGIPFAFYIEDTK